MGISKSRFEIEIGTIKVTDISRNPPLVGMEIGGLIERDVSPEKTFELLGGLSQLIGNRLEGQIAKLKGGPDLK
jgi:hypothetical protein